MSTGQKASSVWRPHYEKRLRYKAFVLGCNEILFAVAINWPLLAQQTRDDESMADAHLIVKSLLEKRG